jgi:hypothetical protein
VQTNNLFWANYSLGSIHFAHGKYIGRLVRSARADTTTTVDYPQEARDCFNKAVAYFECVRVSHTARK